jgi:hypothetical protein
VATCWASQRARSVAQTKFGRRRRGHLLLHPGRELLPGLGRVAAVVDLLLGQPGDLAHRSRRSCSMSAFRSATPSLRVTCQRAERSLSAGRLLLAAVSSEISSATCSGLRCAASSAATRR